MHMHMLQHSIKTSPGITAIITFSSSLLLESSLTQLLRSIVETTGTIIINMLVIMNQ